jgi:hypothetical protein
MSIHFVHVDDWVGIYIDGVRVAEGHSFTPEQVLRMLGIEFHSDSAQEWMDTDYHTFFPANLSEVTFD